MCRGETSASVANASWLRPFAFLQCWSKAPILVTSERFGPAIFWARTSIASGMTELCPVREGRQLPLT